MGADQCLNDLGPQHSGFILEIHSALSNFEGINASLFARKPYGIGKVLRMRLVLEGTFSKVFFTSILNKFQVTAVSSCSIVASILNHNYAQYCVMRSVSITAWALTNVDRTPGNL